MKIMVTGGAGFIGANFLNGSVPELQEHQFINVDKLKDFVTDRSGHDLRCTIDAARIREECGWEPKETFDTGIHKTVQRYLSNQDCVQDVPSGEYRQWMDLNYGDRAG